ncbi:MAG: hypothetical protein ABIR22_10915 [Candidatus Eisenbacteria bacterium]
MGLGAAATKYSLFASLSNMPIWYVTRVDGLARTRFGPEGLLYAEAILGAIGLLVFGFVVAAWRRDGPAPRPVSAATPVLP